MSPGETESRSGCLQLLKNLNFGQIFWILLNFNQFSWKLLKFGHVSWKTSEFWLLGRKCSQKVSISRYFLVKNRICFPKFRKALIQYIFSVIFDESSFVKNNFWCCNNIQKFLKNFWNLLKTSEKLLKNDLGCFWIWAKSPGKLLKNFWILTFFSW